MPGRDRRTYAAVTTSLEARRMTRLINIDNGGKLTDIWFVVGRGEGVGVAHLAAVDEAEVGQRPAVVDVYQPCHAPRLQARRDRSVSTPVTAGHRGADTTRPTRFVARVRWRGRGPRLASG